MLATVMSAALAMVAFAANSLLARAALAQGTIDAASFTSIRLASAALALLGVLMCQRGSSVLRNMPGNWRSAVCLFVYALAFSLAYLLLPAATGALVLFAAVQATMIVGGLMRRDRPTSCELTGLALAFGAFVYLLLPGLQAPDLLGSLLMIASGIAWGIYSLRGRGVRYPLDETAGNFVRCSPLCLSLAVLPVSQRHATMEGVGFAVVSGVVTSGFGYAVWYRVLPRLSTTQAAIVQLTVPPLAAIGAVAFLSETLTSRLVLASAGILGGVAMSLRLSNRAARRQGQG